MSPMSRMVMLGLVVMVIVFICSVEGAEKKGAKKAAKKGDKHKTVKTTTEQPKRRRTYQKQWNQTCRSSKECDIYKGLDCHLALAKRNPTEDPKCVCIFTIHEWRTDGQIGCYDPMAEPAQEGDGEEDIDDAEGKELDEEIPPPEDVEQPAERRRRRKMARARRVLKGGSCGRRRAAAPGKGKGGKKG